eukprot:gene3305-3580_t
MAKKEAWPVGEEPDCWEMTLDPTAGTILDDHLSLARHLCSTNSSRNSIGTGLAGADGVLGRCFTFRLRLDEHLLT